MKASSEDQTPSISLYLVQALKEGSVIVAGLFCLYLFFALVFFDAQDPSWLVSDNHPEVKNATGLAGAYLSGLVLALFGYWAYLFPLLAGWQLFILLHRHRNQPWHWPLFVYRLFGFVILLASGAGLAFLHFSSLQTELQQGSGGILGQRIGFLLLPLFDLLGSTLIMLAALLLGLRMFIDMSWQSVFEGVGGWLTNTWDYLIDRWHQRQQSQLELQEVEAHVESRKVALEEHVKVQQERTPVKIQAPKPVAKPSARLEREKQGSLFTQGDTLLPGIALLDVAEKDPSKSYSTEVLEAMSKRLELKLKDYGIDAQVVAVLPGPVITSFEVKPAAGVKVSKITNLAKDLARSLAVVSVRVVEVIPGKSVIGIEIPNEYREMVRFSEVVASDEFDKAASPITLALGHDISGQPVAVDLAKMPHLLVAGTTGSGKSVGINAMLLSILFKSTPEQVRMILVDPKMLELSVYEGIPHLLTPVVTDMKDAANALKWCVAEMERRYRLMTAMGVRNLAGFNRKIKQAAERDETIPDPTWQPNDSLDAEAPALEHLPLIVVVIDEFADMMMIIGKKIKVDELIARIAQKARAAGIHLILATQRPSVDVITGLIKANVPTRIGFQVSSRIDSRTILDQGGAEQLLGHGDMLYLPPGAGVPVRVHGAFVDDDEVHRVVKDWAERAQPEYIDEVIEPPVEGSIAAGSAFSLDEDGDNPEADEFYDLAVEFVTQTRRASISAVQRKFRIGYNRAARLVETMEAAGVVSTAGHNGGREVLAPAPRAD